MFKIVFKIGDEVIVKGEDTSSIVIDYDGNDYKIYSPTNKTIETYCGECLDIVPNIAFKDFITEVIKCSYCERTFGVSESERIVRLDDIIRLADFYGRDMNFRISNKEVEDILNKYYSALKGENNG